MFALLDLAQVVLRSFRGVSTDLVFHALLREKSVSQRLENLCYWIAMTMMVMIIVKVMMLDIICHTRTRAKAVFISAVYTNTKLMHTKHICGGMTTTKNKKTISAVYTNTKLMNEGEGKGMAA